MIKKKMPVPLPDKVEYLETLSFLKQKIQEAQLRAAVSVNKELIQVYWLIGETIAEKKAKSGWGDNIIETLASDLKKLFPEVRGFSRANIYNIQAFFNANIKVQQLVGQIQNLPFFSIPWGHNVVLIQKIKDQDERLWYAQKTLENGWSRSYLESCIKTDLYSRDGKAITNFKNTLPMPQSKLAQESFKDPYVFDFLELGKDHLEHELEKSMIDNIQKLLIELGTGFAFVGRQVNVNAGGEDFYIDLLFYHTKIKSYIVVELKSCAFKPEHSGQLAFYLTAVDQLIKQPDDNPTIGLILCQTKNNIIVDWALNNSHKPMTVAEYQTAITSKLPKELKGILPSKEELEAELEKQFALIEMAKEKPE